MDEVVVGEDGRHRIWFGEEMMGSPFVILSSRNSWVVVRSVCGPEFKGWSRMGI